MKRHAASHFDHGLTEAQIEYLMKRFADRDAFFIETVELPEALSTVPCGLHGPIVGDEPINDDEVIRLPRGTRPWLSRLTPRQPKPSRLVTVIAGPHEEDCGPSHWAKQCVRCHGEGKIKHACIVYTMYGGPLAPQEPDDPGCKNVEASRAFWAQHALSG